MAERPRRGANLPGKDARIDSGTAHSARVYDYWLGARTISPLAGRRRNGCWRSPPGSGSGQTASTQPGGSPEVDSGWDPDPRRPRRGRSTWCVRERGRLGLLSQPESTTSAGSRPAARQAVVRKGCYHTPKRPRQPIPARHVINLGCYQPKLTTSRQTPRPAQRDVVTKDCP